MAGELIYGFHAVASRVRRNPETVKEVYADPERHDPRMRELLAALEKYAVRLVWLEHGRMDGLVGHVKHQGVAAKVAPLPQRDLFDTLDTLSEPALLVVLDGVQDPHNLGACLRAADAFGAHALIAPKDRAVGLTPVAAKAASGAAENVPFITVTNLARILAELKERGVWVYGAAEDGDTDLPDADLRGASAWVLGAEGAGLRRLTREQCDLRVRIPMLGTVESLNVSVACGVCLYETRRQRARAALAPAPSTANIPGTDIPGGCPP